MNKRRRNDVPAAFAEAVQNVKMHFSDNRVMQQSMEADELIAEEFIYSLIVMPQEIRLKLLEDFSLPQLFNVGKVNTQIGAAVKDV